MNKTKGRKRLAVDAARGEEEWGTPMTPSCATATPPSRPALRPRIVPPSSNSSWYDPITDWIGVCFCFFYSFCGCVIVVVMFGYFCNCDGKVVVVCAYLI